ncbi:MAG: DUF2085 domain-containing protein [Bacteroidales bacterium]
MQPPRRRAAVRLVSQLVLACAAVAWTLLLILAPLFAARSHPSDATFRLAAGAYFAGSLLCHQRADRAFHVGQVHMPVCARCFGLYASASAGAVFALVAALLDRRPGRARSATDRPRHGRLIVLAAVPTVISVLLEVLGIFPQNPAARSVAAIPLGVVVGWFVTFHAGERSRSGVDCNDASVG